MSTKLYHRKKNNYLWNYIEIHSFWDNNELFFTVKSSGTSKEYCSDFGDDEQISPYSLVIWLIIVWLSSHSLANGEGVKGLHSPIEYCGGGDDDDKHGEIGDVCWVIEHVESISSIFSNWIIVGRNDSSSLIDDNKQEQWERDVTVFSNVKRRGI